MAEIKHTEKNLNLLAMANIVLFVSVLAVGGILSLVLPEEKISESEKRELTPMPTFSVEKLFEGNYTDSLDLHYSDNFPFRDGFVEISGFVKEAFGYRANDVKIYTADQLPPTVEVEPVKDSLAVVKVDTVSEVKQLDSIKHTKDFGSSILIHDGMAFQMFGGSENRAIGFAEMINAYRQVLDDSIKIYCLIAPTSIDFYLPDNLRGSRSYEKPNIKISYDHLDSGIIAVDAYSEIEAHKNEYLYFNTDHHWTGRGAYYAYRAFCNSAGFPPAELSAFRRKVRKGYLGSLYDITKDVSLRANRDSIETFKPPIEADVYRYANGDLKDPVKANLIAGSGNYATFLGGDFPLVRIKSQNQNGRVALVIKDSYGNAVCPFLTMDFEEVIVVDYRYFEKNLVNFILQNGVTDFIFLHNTFVVNTEFTVKKERFLMRKKESVPVKVEPDTIRKEIEKVEVKKDSTK